MKHLPIALSLLLLTGCSESTPAPTAGSTPTAGGSTTTPAAGGSTTSGAVGQLGGLASGLTGSAGSALDALKGFDIGSLGNLDGLSKEALTTKGSQAVQSLASQLGSINDLPGAEAVVKAVQPWMDKLGQLKDSLGGVLPDSVTLEGAIDALEKRFDANGDVMKVLQPVLAKLKGLVG